ncbi:MAG: ribosome biogenesis GTPase Der [Myxococcota bacterium]|nr:ribosome biogenesis GTPase Der [Myxococcota bacterium]
MVPMVAIVGRPNVGKSTLFNRLVGERKAIVDDRPGVTRDRQFESLTRYGPELLLVDTGGLEPNPEDGLYAKMRTQALIAIEEADVVLFVVDGRAGILPLDQEVSELLRRADKPVLLIINKMDTFETEDHIHEFYALGLEDMIPVSAEHSRGLSMMMDRVYEVLPPLDKKIRWEDDGEEEQSEIRMAVLGRPNIGKSTLVNRLIGEERQVVHDAPGTTMDAVDAAFELNGQNYTIVDTAGVRRKSRISDKVEGFAVSRAIRTIERCHVTLLMIDGTEGPTDQDARLAYLAADRGRALIICINKWDLVREDPERNVRVLMDEMERQLPHAKWAPPLYISALTGKGVGKIIERVHEVYEQFDKRLSTAECNRFLEAAQVAHSPPQSHNRPVRLNYMSQVRVRPPTFNIWTNNPEGVQESYKRFLVNRMREIYGFEGTPIRVRYLRKRRPGEAKAED